MRWGFIGWMALACVASVHAQVTAPVTLDSGRITGIVDDGIQQFLGIPYAAPPVGDRRWRPPSAAGDWDGIRPMDRYGHRCMQVEPTYDPHRARETMSEDCLYLNVWTPTTTPGEPMPVMVWVHGGGFVQGAASGPVDNGSHLARRGVVVVSFNYRLGRFGFFAHPALTAAAGDEPLGNYGVMDQIAALQWVEKNIAAFGGDANNITVFGESAGGGAINILLSSPAASGLIDKAIVQSGGGRELYSRLAEDRSQKPAAESYGLAFAKKAGLDADATTAELRAIPAKTVTGSLGLSNMEPDTYGGIIIDGNILRGEAHAEFARGRHDMVPYLIGSNNGELSALPIIDFMTQQLLAEYGPAENAIRQLYDPDGGTTNLKRHLVNEAYFAEPARRFARHMAAAGARTYLYRFSYVAQPSRAANSTGAAHASEITFVFNTLHVTHPQATAADKAMAQLMGDYWVDFARTGDPNGEGRAQWPRYDRAEDPLLEFTHEGPQIRRHLNEKRLDKLAEHYPHAD